MKLVPSDLHPQPSSAISPTPTIEIRLTNGVWIFVPMRDVSPLREVIAVDGFLSVPARRDDGISIHPDDINEACEIHRAGSFAEDATR